MKSTSFCYCLAILIAALPNSQVQCHRINQLSARYAGPNERKFSATTPKQGFGTKNETTVSVSAENTITNSSSPSKISSTNRQSSERRPSNRPELVSTERQDTKRSGIELSTTKYQNSQRSNVNGATEKVATVERDTSKQLSGRPTSPNRNQRPSTSDQASSVAPDAQNFQTSTRSKPGAANSLSPVVGQTDNQFTAPLRSGFRGESTTTMATEKWTSTPSSTSTSTRVGSRFVTKATTTGGLVTGSASRNSSTTVGPRYTSSTESTSTRAGNTKENGGDIVFPGASSTRTTSRTTNSNSGNAIPSGFTTLAPSTNGTSKPGNETDKIDNKVIIDVPPFDCKQGEKKDTDNVCRKVL